MSVQTEELQVHFSETGASNLESAYQRIGTANDRLSQSVTRTTGSFSNYLKSDKAITGNLREITSLAISGANAQDLLAASIYRVGASFKGALVVGATLAVGHTIYQGLKKASDEADALEKSINRVLQYSGPTDMKSVAQISSQLEEVRKNRATLEKQLNEPVKTSLITDPLANARKNPIRTALALVTGGLGGGFLSAVHDKGAANHREKRLGELREKEGSLLEELAKKEKAIADIAETRMHVSEREADLAMIRAKYAEKIGEAESAGPGQNPAKARELHRLQDLEIEAANRKNDALEDQLDLEISIARVRQPSALGGQVLTMDEQRLEVLQKQADEAERQLKASKELTKEARQRATRDHENARNDRSPLELCAPGAAARDHLSFVNGQSTRAKDFAQPLGCLRVWHFDDCGGSVHRDMHAASVSAETAFDHKFSFRVHVRFYCAPLSDDAAKLATLNTPVSA